MTSIATAVATLATRVAGSSGTRPPTTIHLVSTPVDGEDLDQRAAQRSSPRATQRAAGERAAAAALRHAGSSGVNLLGRAADGCPQWPPGFVGSIAHTDSIAVAAVAPGAALAALGVDIEVAAALPASDAALVLGAAERAVVEAHLHPDRCATLLWSAKEAAFKAWSAATGGLGTVDPVDLAVRLDEAASGLEVVALAGLRTATAPFAAAVGGYVEADGYVVTLVVVPSPTESG